jgi:SagB-type dehydrogenase family enzyme
VSKEIFLSKLEQFDYDDLFTDLMKSEQRSVAWRSYHAPRSNYSLPNPSDKVQSQWLKVSLPDIPLQETMNDAKLMDCLRARKSYVLSQMDQSWHLHDLAALLSLAAGVRTETKVIGNLGETEMGENSLRTYPSGGALYPVELYIYARAVSELAPGFYKYVAEENALFQIEREYSERELAGLFPMTTYQMDDNRSLANTAFIAVLVANLEYSFSKYGRLAHQLALLEAGHIGQNMQLVSTSMEKRSLPSCGYFSDKIAEALGISKNKYKHIVYCLFFG